MAVWHPCQGEPQLHSERGVSKRYTRLHFINDVSVFSRYSICALSFQVIKSFIYLKLPFDVFRLFPVTNLTAGTDYEVAVWAHTSIGDSPTVLSHPQTTGTQPERPLLKAKALNQTAVDCSWTISGPPAQVQQTVNRLSSFSRKIMTTLHVHQGSHS